MGFGKLFMEMMLMELNEKLQNLRKENHLSQEKIAELVGVSRQSVSKWEVGLSKPDTNNLIRLADIYGVSLDELIGTAESTEQLHSQNVKPYIPKFVLLSYIVSFAAIIGYFCPPISNLPQPYILWICMALIGGIMLVMKNRKLIVKSNYQRITKMDTAILTLLISSGWLLPNFMGILKALILAIPAGIYTVWVCMKFFLVKN